MEAWSVKKLEIEANLKLRPFTVIDEKPLKKCNKECKVVNLDKTPRAKKAVNTDINMIISG
jgi:hypothetical protein